MITFPTTPEEALAAEGSYRAGGTDLMDLRHLGRRGGDTVDLRDVAGLDAVEPTPGGGLRIGARITVAALAEHPAVRAGYPALAMTAGGLATPQIRARGTLGGNLLQDARCWYFRNPTFRCLKAGGSTCFAREGDNLFHSVFDQGPCVAIHPSSLGMALMAWDAQVDIAGGASRTVAALMGDGRDPRRTHTLEPGALITAVLLPPPHPGDRSTYFRAIHRARAEWPLVEVVARLVVDGSRIGAAAVTVGGVANTPLRLAQVEAALLGQPATQGTLDTASAKAADGASPLSMTGYKVDLVKGAVLTALEQALASAPVTAAAGGEGGAL